MLQAIAIRGRPYKHASSKAVTFAGVQKTTKSRAADPVEHNREHHEGLTIVVGIPFKVNTIGHPLGFEVYDGVWQPPLAHVLILGKKKQTPNTSIHSLTLTRTTT